MPDPASDTTTADDKLRAAVANLPIPKLDSAFTTAPELKNSRVAVVTTAGLMRHGEAPWTHDDAGYRMFNVDENDLIAGHVSISFDRAGMALDRNVFYPLDRLREMADAGEIGSIAPRHISFMGALRTPNELSTLILDSGIRAARELLDDGVDVVLLTPVCPACSRTVLILGQVFEAQGLSTVVLASNLELARRARAPRALFCDFPLGRPVGPPNEPDLQLKVLRAALDLLNRTEGPVLEIFPDVIKDEASSPVSCALPPRYDPDIPPPVDEASGLLSAWERAYKRNGGTHVGRIINAEDVPRAIQSFVSVAEGRPWKEVFTSEDAMLQTAADIRVYYEEVATSLAGHVPAAKAAEAWFYQLTETGKLFRQVTAQLRASGQEADMSLMALAYIVPESQSDMEYSPEFYNVFREAMKSMATADLNEPREE